MRSRRPIRKIKISPANCPFCKSKIAPNYKEAEALKGFLSERGKIIGRDRLGLCSRHQRQLTVEIKRARFLGLLPFVVRVK